MAPPVLFCAESLNKLCTVVLFRCMGWTLVGHLSHLDTFFLFSCDSFLYDLTWLLSAYMEESWGRMGPSEKCCSLYFFQLLLSNVVHFVDNFL